MLWWLPWKQRLGCMGGSLILRNFQQLISQAIVGSSWWRISIQGQIMPMPRSSDQSKSDLYNPSCQRCQQSGARWRLHTHTDICCRSLKWWAAIPMWLSGQMILVLLSSICHYARVCFSKSDVHLLKKWVVNVIMVVIQITWNPIKWSVPQTLFNFVVS